MNIPVPPRDILLNALGAQGLVSPDATRIAIWWEPSGDEAFVGDGRMSGTCNWQPYLTFVCHASVESYLRGYNLGSSEDIAEHWLVFDFSADTAQVLPVAEAQAFLMEQWPSAAKGEGLDDVEPLSEEDVERIAAQMVAQLRDFQNTLRQAGTQSVQDVREAHRALVAWLDAETSGAQMQPGTKTMHLAGQKRVVSERRWQDGAGTHRTELRRWTETSLDAPGIPRMYIRKKVVWGDRQLLILHVPGFQRFGGQGARRIYQPSEVWVFLIEENLPRPKIAPPEMIGTIIGAVLLMFETGQSLRKALDFAEAYVNQWTGASTEASPVQGDGAS